MEGAREARSDKAGQERQDFFKRSGFYAEYTGNHRKAF